MGKTTEISWTDHTFNPWWGCQRVSPGCENCYAETFDKRVGGHHWGPAKTTSRRLFGDKHWSEPFTWDHEAQRTGSRRRVFCASMSDVFEDHPTVGPLRERLWQTIGATPFLDWLVLTKRPENIAAMMTDRYWPNVWLGTSTEDQQRADERVTVLLRHRDRVPVLFLSVEPMLGPIDLGTPWPPTPPLPGSGGVYAPWMIQQLDWVIVGGESGPRHRPFNEDWARSLRDQCQANGVAFHFKQHGGRTHAEGGCLLDGREWKEFPDPRRELAHA